MPALLGQGEDDSENSVAKECIVSRNRRLRDTAPDIWCSGMTAAAAYEVVKGPLMALIGGSLAISKDLIPLGIDSEVRDKHSDKNNQ